MLINRCTECATLRATRLGLVSLSNIPYRFLSTLTNRNGRLTEIVIMIICYTSFNLKCMQCNQDQVQAKICQIAMYLLLIGKCLNCGANYCDSSVQPRNPTEQKNWYLILKLLEVQQWLMRLALLPEPDRAKIKTNVGTFPYTMQ